MQEQSFKSHAKFVPAFHYFVGPVLMINVINSVIRTYHSFNYEHAFGVLLALALLALAFLARIFALKVQDRVIRLEMRLKLRELLPADLQPRILDFRPGQLVALRFASDAELPTLARKVLDENLTDQRSIKSQIQNWQPDHLRA
ncbi:MAG: DUF6526 family protein [Candidatus Acidiferrales bacterium]|jgi:hypothetical protein